jgi:hypothetical protein
MGIGHWALGIGHWASGRSRGVGRKGENSSQFALLPAPPPCFPHPPHPLFPHLPITRLQSCEMMDMIAKDDVKRGIYELD